MLAPAVVIVVVTAASIAIGLQVTPLATVSALGETVQVGAASPSFDVSGPGELDLFGQSFPTVVTFNGPVRPRLVLSQITVSRQLASLFPPSLGSTEATESLGQQLADGFTRYFVWEVLIVAGSALLLLGAFAGWRRYSGKHTAIFLAVGLLVVEACNLGGIMVTAYSAPHTLSQVRSLDQLVGQSDSTPVSAPPGPAIHGIHAVVLGDSTAAGDGLAPVSNPSALDSACQRSQDSYALDLARVNDWQVLNLACSSATVPAGLLGSQQIGGLVAPAQVGAMEQVKGESVVIVSVGADDVQWAASIQLCAVSPVCDNNAATAFFQGELATFTQNYFQLLRSLADLPEHPQVIINSYYDPFNLSARCLEDKGMTNAKLEVLIGDVNALNTVLANGAKASGFTSVQPDFTGHQLCSAEPYVQGLQDKAPFHPTAAGALAIALADERAIVNQQQSGQRSR